MAKFGNKIWIVAVALVSMLLFVAGIWFSTPRTPALQIESYTPLPSGLSDSLAPMPVLDGGRVKPLESYARFSLLKIAGKQSLKVRDKQGQTHTVSAMDWLNDCLWRPRLAAQYPVFIIDSDEVLNALDIPTHDKKRDRYSYVELLPKRQLITNMSIQIEQRDAKTLDTVSKQILELEKRLQVFESLAGSMEFGRRGLRIGGEGWPGEIAQNRQLRYSDLAGDLAAIMAKVEQLRAASQSVPTGLADLYRQLAGLELAARHAPRLIADGDRVISTGELLKSAHAAGLSAAQIAELQTIEDLQQLEANDPHKFAASLIAWHQKQQQQLANNPAFAAELEHAALEVRYHRLDLLFVVSILSAMSCCALLVRWLSPQGWWGKLCSIAAWLLAVVALLGLAAVLVLRSIIAGRPPVGNFYDTIPFITFGVLAVCAVLELFTKRKLALLSGCVLCYLGAQMAIQYVQGNPSDNLDPLVAVLRSNFWLSTHVITVTLGYSAGLVAAGIAKVYFVGRIFKLDGGDRQLRRSLTRMVYSSMCFCLLLSLIGTILGGIWANDSWGRFWGWDPKENGALMIVLWSLIVLHARLAGWIKEWGMHLCALVMAIIVAFSWWYVNMLGVGLHSYGFTDGKTIIKGFFVLETALVVLCWSWHRLVIVGAKKSPGAASVRS